MRFSDKPVSDKPGVTVHALCMHGTVRPHLSVPQISSSLTFCSYCSFYWNKSAIILLYTILLLPHLSSSLTFCSSFYWNKSAIILLYTILLLPHFISTVLSKTDVCAPVGSDCIAFLCMTYTHTYCTNGVNIHTYVHTYSTYVCMYIPMYINVYKCMKLVCTYVYLLFVYRLIGLIRLWCQNVFIT